MTFYQETLRPHTAASEFDIGEVEVLPAVAIVSDFTGIDPELVTHFGDRPLSGLVVRTFAGGRMSAGMLSGLAELSRGGTPIVVTSRVPGGRIVDPPDYDFPAVVASDLPDNKARVLLMLALTKTRDIETLQRIFDTY